MADFTYNNHLVCEAAFEFPDSVATVINGQDPLNVTADIIPENTNQQQVTTDMTTGGPFTCRMKGFDSVLATWVYWSSAGNDPNGRNYRGPGTVSRVVVAFVFPVRQQAASL